MKFASLFSKKIWLYYLIQFAAFAINVVFIALMPYAYTNWILPQVIPYTLCMMIGFFALWFMLCDATGKTIKKSLILAGICGFFCGASYWFFHGVLTLIFEVDIFFVMKFVEITLLAVTAIGHVFLFVKTSHDVFELRKRLRDILTVCMLCILAIGMVSPFLQPFFRTYIRKYSFLAEPVVFVNADGYSIIFATSAPGTGSVTIKTATGEEITYADELEHAMVFDSQIHRIDVSKEVLDGATYYVTSRKTGSGSSHYLDLKKEIRSKEYVFRPVKREGDVSFLTISDNQGTALPTQKAVRKASQNYEYDFVFMLGDHAEMYNDYEDDVINSFLKVAFEASKGEIPVYYTMGNHEYRGMLSTYVQKLIPTPLKENKTYYTFTAGDAYFTVLNYGVDHDDDYEQKYSGAYHHNAFRDEEYAWLEGEMAKKNYENYKYNVCISHIPLILRDEKDKDKIDMMYEFVCQECKKVHDYKYREFTRLLQQNGVTHVVSGHTHKEPEMFERDDCSFKQLNTGSYYAGKTKYRNVIVHLQNGEFSYDVYS